MKEKKLQLINYQLITSVLFIISLIISIVLTYDEKQELLKKQRLFSETFDKYLNLFNRIFALLIIVTILYINYKDYELNKNTRNSKSGEHQVIASVFSVISALIVLYVVIENWYENPNITSIENPIV